MLSLVQQTVYTYTYVLGMYVEDAGWTSSAVCRPDGGWWGVRGGPGERAELRAAAGREQRSERAGPTT